MKIKATMMHGKKISQPKKLSQSFFTHDFSFFIN